MDRLVRYGTVRYGTVTVRIGRVRYGNVRYGTGTDTGSSIIWYGTVPYCTVRYLTVRNRTVPVQYWHRPVLVRYRAVPILYVSRVSPFSKLMETKNNFGPILDLCVSSLRRGHANLLCIVPILSGVLERTTLTRKFYI